MDATPAVSSVPVRSSSKSKVQLRKGKYVDVPRTATRNHMHGIEVSNPYEYLEDPEYGETRNFVEKQNAFFQNFIGRSKFRTAIQRKLTAFWNVPYKGVPRKFGKRIFTWENAGTENHNVLYVEDTPGKARKLLDPNVWDVAGRYAISNFKVSPNGKYLAYAISERGSDWLRIRVRDCECGHDLEEQLRFAKFSRIEWTKDSVGFFYQRFPVPHVGDIKVDGTLTHPLGQAKLYYHTVGTRQEDDVLAIEFPAQITWNMSVEVSDDGDYLFVYASDVIGEKYLHFSSLKEGVTEKMKLTRLFNAPGNHSYLTSDGPVFYLMTTVGAGNFHHVVRVNLSLEGKGKYEVIVPDQGKKVLWATVVNQNKLVICYVKELYSHLEVRDLKSGKLIPGYNEKFATVEKGTFTDYFAERSGNELYFKTESYTRPGVIYKMKFTANVEDTKLETHYTTVIPNMASEDFSFSVHTFSSDDGSIIPIGLLHHKDLARDSARPTILTAYGAFGTSVLPTFHFPYLFFAQHFQGVVAIANVRGGGEYGKNWWDEGKLLNKKNGVDDFVAAARFLCHNAYTKPDKLAITGASAGGLLVGAVVNQRPELFGAAIPRVGIMDMLRFHKFTAGSMWFGEFGNPEDSTYFHYLKEYSPIHNIRPPQDGQYPAILVTTADHDDRVVPSHSYKYLAELQNMASSNPRQKNPFYLKVYSEMGHVSGKPKQAKIEEWTDMLAFLELTLEYALLGTH